MTTIDFITESFCRLDLVNHFKKVRHRQGDYFKSRLAYTMALFNVLVQWDGLEIDENAARDLSLPPRPATH